MSAMLKIRSPAIEIVPMINTRISQTMTAINTGSDFVNVACPMIAEAAT